MIKFLKALFSKPRSQEYEILFGSHTAGKGEHGSIQGTWVKAGINAPKNISFYFRGRVAPPPLTKEVLDELYFQARFVGIEVVSIYGWQGISGARPNGITSGPMNNM